MALRYIGIDIGGTNVKIGLFDYDMKLLKKTSVPTNADMGPESLVERIVTECKNILLASYNSVDDVEAIGIGTPGPANYPEGIIIRATNMPKFKDTPLRDMISRELWVPAILENDANVACWAEFTVGVGMGVDDLVFFTLGTGIGGGIVINGELITGCNYNAAELGHVIIYPDGRECNCGQKGCVEAYASANATAARATEAIKAGAESSLKSVLSMQGEITCKDVYDHLAAGDQLAKEITDGTAKALALMCINMLHTTEPKRIVFSGGVIAAGDILVERIKYYFDEMIWHLKPESLDICLASLGEDTGIIGAAAIAKHAKEQGKI